MKNKTLRESIAVVGLGLSLVGVILFLSLRPGRNPHTRAIAILAPRFCRPIERIQEGFKQVLSRSKKSVFVYTCYYNDGDRTLLRSQAEEILNKNYSLVFTIGQSCTLMMKEVSLKKHKLLPIVFGAVQEPFQHGLVVSEKFSGNNLTGAASEISSRALEQLALLLSFKKDIKRLIIPYSAHGAGLMVGQDLQLIQRAAESRGVMVLPIAIFSPAELFEKIAPFLEEGDMIMVLRDSMITSGMNILGKLGGLYKVPVFGSDLDSVRLGAALGFGPREIDTGILAGEKALLILDKKKKPSEIPISIPNFKYLMIFNRKKMEEQNFVLSSTSQFLIKHTRFV